MRDKIPSYPNFLRINQSFTYLLIRIICCSFLGRIFTAGSNFFCGSSRTDMVRRSVSYSLTQLTPEPRRYSVPTSVDCSAPCATPPSSKPSRRPSRYSSYFLIVFLLFSLTQHFPNESSHLVSAQFIAGSHGTTLRLFDPCYESLQYISIAHIAAQSRSA